MGAAVVAASLLQACFGGGTSFAEAAADPIPIIGPTFGAGFAGVQICAGNTCVPLFKREQTAGGSNRVYVL